MKRGIFIAIEGIDGAGTTTQARRLHTMLAAKGVPAFLTREPSNGPVGSLIRQILSGRCVSRALKGKTCEVDPVTLALLFAADRTDHLQNEIMPALRSGVTVITDRYYHSSFAYQSLNCPVRWVREINGYAPEPDITFLLDIGAETGMRRVVRREGRAERFESEKTLRRVARNYRGLKRILKGERIEMIDGLLSEDEVFNKILSQLCKLFPQKLDKLL